MATIATRANRRDERGIMNKALLVAAAALLLVVPAVNAVELGTISLGFHLNPALEVEDGPRTWDLSLSLSVGAKVGTSSSVELVLVVDSGPSSLGATFSYYRHLTDPFTVGAGLNMFWRFETEETLVRTVISSFAHASARTNLFTDFVGEAGLSFPLMTFARQTTGWEILPLAELPAIHLAGEWQAFASAALQGRLTLQPVIIDTTQFEDPIGRISEDLLVLPTYSAFLRFMP
jgi:hypothetical protein